MYINPQYCGRTPPDVLLEVDHLVAVANGGSDEIINLITSCEGCNRGKAAKPVTEILSPDATAEGLRLQQEIVEAKRYLEQQAELQRLRLAISEYLREEWKRIFQPIGCRPPTRSGLSDIQIKAWLANYSPEELSSAWEIVAGYMERGKDLPGSALFSYITGVLKNLKRNSGAAPINV